MADDLRYSAFVFAPDASYGLISKLKSQGLPKGVRYAASVTGPWKIFAVLNFEALQALTAITDLLFGGADGSADPPTALVLGMGQVRKTDYLNETALVRVDLEDVGEDALERILTEIRETISPEVDRVLGNFDLLVCVGADDDEPLNDRIMQLRRISGVRRTVSLRVLDYVSVSDSLDGGHPNKGFIRSE
jgi:DNA-binding Lrp family transcriptional regulator